MKRSKMVLGAALAAVSVGLAACDWDFGGAADQMSGRYSCVNFTGLYRAPAGGLLVTEYSTVPGDSGNVVRDEIVGTGDGARTAWTGRLANRMIVPGTVTIRAGGMMLSEGNGDDDENGNGQDGTLAVQHTTGVFAVTFDDPPAPGTAIIASYEYTQPSGGGSGIRIVTFNVIQEGNQLRFVDNNGSVYTGEFGSVRSTGGEARDTPLEGTIPAGGQVIAQFSVRGRSAAGYDVTITGTFQANVSVATQTEEGVVSRVTLSDRTLLGTWLERRGRTGDVQGVAAGVQAPTGG